MKAFNLKQRGISLLEVMLSLAIIAVILVMATRYFGIASKDARINKATQEVGEIKQGYTRFQLDYGNLNTTLAQLGTDGYITTQTANGVNPWGGAYIPNTNDKTLSINGITPQSDCNNLAARFNTTCDTNRITIPLLQ